MLDVSVTNTANLESKLFSKRVKRFAVAGGEWFVTIAPVLSKDFTVSASVQKLNEYGLSRVNLALKFYETEGWKYILHNEIYVTEEARALEESKHNS